MRVTALPQPLLELQRFDLPTNLLVALLDHVQVGEIVDVLFLLWLLSGTWCYTSEVAHRICLLLTRSSSSSPLVSEGSESTEICYSYNPTFRRTHLREEMK
jgi:hypothetical protein